jgi:hypothetical protein
MRPLPNLASAAITLLTLAAPRLAGASPIFPDAIKTDLSLTYSLGTTHCIICHASNTGGVGTVVSPFGLAMRAAGLKLENTASLQTALQTLDADKTDSDCNGTPDIEQLKAGQDPNTGAFIDGSGHTSPAPSMCTNAETGPIPGCGAQLSRGPTPWQGAVVLLATLGAVLARRECRRYGSRSASPRTRR